MHDLSQIPADDSDGQYPSLTNPSRRAIQCSRPSTDATGRLRTLHATHCTLHTIHMLFNLTSSTYLFPLDEEIMKCRPKSSNFDPITNLHSSRDNLTVLLQMPHTLSALFCHLGIMILLCHLVEKLGVMKTPGFGW